MNLPFDPAIALFVFVTYVCIDILWVVYMSAVEKKRSVLAANYATLISVLCGVVVVNYVHNIWYILAMAGGSWIGTYVVTEWKKRYNT